MILHFSTTLARGRIRGCVVQEGWEQSPRVAMTVTLATLALYNMSYLAPNQPVIGQTCLPALLQVAPALSRRVEAPS